MNTWAGRLALRFFFSAVVAVGGCGILTPCKVAASATPSITTQPQSQSVVAGSNAVFTVEAGGQGTLAYQWSLNGTNLTDNTHISGSTSTNLTIRNVVAVDAGNYRVVVSNSHGSVTSSNATLTVLIPAAITSQPTNAVASIGGSAVFSVTDIGTVPRFEQWQKDGTNLINDGRVSGVTSPTLTISNVQMSDVGSYQLIVTNAYGGAASTAASLLVVPVVVWGDNTYGETDVPSTATNAVAVAAGVDFVLALKNDSTVAGWGNDAIPNPFPPAGLSNVASIAAGGYFGLALKSNGTVVGWGDNQFGETNPPAGLTNVVAVAAGDLFGLALKNDGTVTAWGYNYYGQTNVPAGLSNVVAIAAGWDTGFALKSDGTVVGWGNDYAGEANPPAGLSNVVAIDAGLNLGLALKSDGTVVGWGNNYAGKTYPPAGLSNVVAIAGGEDFSLALKSDGAIVSWGVTNPPSDRLSNVVSIAGFFHTLALVQNPAVQVPPTIWWQPSDRVLRTGQTTILEPYLHGSLPMTYQWFFNGAPLSGETNRWLVLDSIQPGQVGAYQFVAANNYGSVTSSVMNVSELPSIVTQPVSQDVLLSSNVAFSATAIGPAPLDYQWYFNGSPLTDGSGVSGSGTTNLTILNVQTNDAGSYELVVTNDYGSVTSAVATLTVILPVQITQQPASESVLLGSNTTFSVTATGSGPLAYHWYFNGTPLSDGGRISGSTTPTLNISNVQSSDAGGYVAVITNLLSSATSQTASLTPQAVLAPSVRYVNLNNPNPAPPYLNWSTAATNIQDAVDASINGDLVLVTNGVYATGGRTVNGYALTNRVAMDKAVTVQSVNGPSFTSIQGFSSPPYTASSTRGVYMTNGAMLAGFTIANGSTLGVSWPNTTPENSGGGIWCESTSAVISNCVLAGNFADVTGCGVYGGTLYNCTLTNNSGGGGAGASSSILSNCLLAGNSTIDGGGGAANCTLDHCTLIGNSAQWAGGALDCTLDHCTIATNSASSGGGVAGGTVNNCTLTANTASIDGGGAMDDAASHCTLNNCILTGNSVSVASGGNLPAQGGGAYFCTLNNCVLSNNQVINSVQDTRQTLGGGAFGGVLNNCVLMGNTANWYYGGGGGACNAVLINCTVVGNSTYNYSAGASGGGTLNCTVSNSIVYFNGFSQVSGANYAGGTLNYCCTSPLPTGTGNVSTDPLFVNQSANDFHLQSNSPCINSGNNDCVASTTDLDGNPRIVGGTVDIGAYEYQVPLYFLLSPTNQNVLVGSNIVLSASAVGDQPAYQWWFNGAPLANGGRIAGSRSNSLTVSLSQTTDTGSYWVTASNIAGVVTSAVAVVTVLQQPVIITAQPTDKMVLVGSNATFTVTASGVVPPNYLWYSNGVALTNGGRISGVTSPTLTISGAQTNDGAAYQVVVTNSYGAVTSQVATLTVLAPVQITGQPASEAILLGSNAMFSVAAAGSGPLNYQWYFNGMPLVDNSHISGSATPTLRISNVQSGDAGGYIVVVSNLLSSATSLTASLTPQATLSPSVRYVALTSTNPTPPYLNWSTAATNIQDAIDASVAGDLVLVSNGVYQTGGRAVYGVTPNRVVINKALTVQSVNGPAATTIVGFYNPLAAYPYGRCAYLTNNASLTGFTLTSGGAETSGDVILEQSGGGVWCASSSAVISNCVFSGNHAPRFGGGAFGGTLINCVLTNNIASQGGGSCSNTLINCSLFNNFASFQNLNSGGGAYGCTLSNCLLVANRSNGGGGGAYSSTLNNCVLSNNTANAGGGICIGIVNCSLVSSNFTRGSGGGAYSNVLNNCTLTNNFAEYGGAAAFSTLNACFVLGNRALNLGGGAYLSIANNSLFTGNTASAGGTATYGGMLESCTVVSNISPPTAAVAAVSGSAITNSIVYDNSGGNIINTKNMFYVCSIPYTDTRGFTNAPLFVNEAAGDFHLQSNSPCINSGNNAYVTSATDLGGNPRIVGGTVDIGAYEYQTPVSEISYAWLQQYGLPITTNVDSEDLDGTAFNVYQDWIAGLDPTNSLSVLALLPPVPTNNPAGLLVSWESVSNRTYFLQGSTNLAAQPAFSTIQSNIVGQPDTTSFMDTNAIGHGPFFYRVGVQ